MKNDDGVPLAAEFHEDEALGGEDGGVFDPVTQNFFEGDEGVFEEFCSPKCMCEVDLGGDQRIWLSFVLGRDFECAPEVLAGFEELFFIVVDDAEFVEQQGVGFAQVVGGFEVFAGEGEVVELQILHAEEELWEMRALEEAGGGGVGGDGLVVLALGGEGVRKAYPCGTKVRIHHGGLGEVAACFGYASDGEVVDADG
ncbi:hypothetical protein HBI80_078990 [Parastagonospora nodorum]|nr:hypothetical protein HBI80_078990 [Parastagonospora nodorum]